MMNISRPAPEEFAAYYATYVNKVPEGDLHATVAGQIDAYNSALGSIDDKAALYRYAPGKWTVKEVLGHVVDSERVFAYRAMRFAREDPTPLPGFDENFFVAHADFNSRSIADLLSEFEFVRRGNIALFSSFSAAVGERRGTANEIGFSVRAIVYICVGHAQHHLEILKEKYL